MQVLWAGTDEASAIRRYDVVKHDDIERFGTVIVSTQETQTAT
ncbi:hypothetical protein [Dactylosporangium sp. NPDC049140]